MWMLYAEREGATPTPLEWKSVGFEDYFPKDLYGRTKIRVLAFWQGKHLAYYMDKNDVDAIDRYAFEHFLEDPRYIEKLSNGTIESRQKFQVFLKTLTAQSLAKKTNQELAQIFDQFAELYKVSFGVGFIGALGGKTLQKHISNGLAVSDVAVLTAPRQDSLFVQANKALEKLAAKKKVTHTDLEQYLKNYNFIGYDYAGPALTRQKLLDLIGEIKKQAAKHTKNDYQSVEKKLKLTSEQKRLFSILAELAYLKELRNTTDDLAHYKLDLLLDEIGKRFNLTRQDLRYYRPQEISTMLEKSQRLPDDELAQRKTAVVSDTSLEPTVYLIGRVAIDYYKKQIPDEDLSAVKEVKGLVAQPGRVKGTVHIIATVSKVPSFQYGEILVSPMTSPAYMPAIRKAAAIVTNEGGMTSHAAIVSREFGIPCVVGTKLATKIFKTGDIIEVDANIGIVRKI